MAAAVCLGVGILLPASAPDSHTAAAQSLGEGLTVSGDFKGTGHAQIASLFDRNEDLGLRIQVLDRAATADAFTAELWTVWGAGSFDTSRAMAAAADVDRDGKTDIAVLYNDGGTSVRILVFRSTGTSFQYLGAWWQSSGYAFTRVKAMLAGDFSAVGNTGLLLIYQYDSFQMRIHYFESDGTRFVFNGNGGVYDSGPGQYDTAKMRVAAGDVDGDGKADLASLYGYADGSTRVQLFSGATSLAPVGGAAGIGYTAPGQLAWGTAAVF